jgi:hypothetical protein
VKEEPRTRKSDREWITKERVDEMENEDRRITMWVTIERTLSIFYVSCHVPF